MTEVGVREFKAKLSHYLKRARAGERVVVTDHGKPVAVVGPVAESPVEAAIWKMVAEGKVRWNGGKPKGLNPGVKLLGGPSAAQTVIEDRE